MGRDPGLMGALNFLLVLAARVECAILAQAQSGIQLDTNWRPLHPIQSPQLESDRVCCGSRPKEYSDQKIKAQIIHLLQWQCYNILDQKKKKNHPRPKQKTRKNFIVSVQKMSI